MDSFDLSKLCEALDDVNSPLITMSKEIYANGSIKLDTCLVGKILGNKPVSREGFISTFQQALHVTNNFDIELVGNDNIFAFYSKQRHIVRGFT
ncbi:hypothetical protein Scep_025827 [Stephania cephalantha]|uniref:Uncharacterized protein n=1 Tax=Stephania cephalantha TaxID=152367 RepID=A0AAP0ER87_9MAGN